MKENYPFFCLLVMLTAPLNAQNFDRVSGMTEKSEQPTTMPQATLERIKSVSSLEDGFETYTDFALSFSPWTLVDEDLYQTYGIDGVEYTNKYDPMAFMIFNPSQTSPPMTNPAIQPHAGDKFAACIASDGGANNDWLITPPISLGTNSSLSLWVKSFTDEYGLERYKIGVSTTNTTPSSFTIISGSSHLTAPATAWEQKTFDLNNYNGQTVYIGIQCVSDDSFIFMVDDVVVSTDTPAINPPNNLTVSLNATNGQVNLNWSHQTAKSNKLDWETNQWVEENDPMRSFQNFRIYRNGSLLTTTTSLSYDDQLPQYGTYNYTVTAYYTAGESTPAGPVSITWESSGGETATLTGLVTDATNGNPIQDATVTIAGLSTTTNSDGNYTIENLPGALLLADFTSNVTQGEAPLTITFTDQSRLSASTVTCSKAGYETYSNNQVTVSPGQTLTLNISLSPQLSGDEIRFVLNWGAQPLDLVLQLLTPEIEGQTWHVWYDWMGNVTSVPYAALDHDVTNGYGPETMTIYQRYSGIYKCYVYNFSGNPDITTSSGVVQIYNETGLISTVQVPQTGTGLYWNVAEVDGATGQLTIINTIQEQAPEGKNVEMPAKDVKPQTNSSRDIVSWNWSFGDGTTSTLQNPTKVYNEVGSYTVSLTVSDGSSQSTKVKAGFIVVGGSSVEENKTDNIKLYPVPAHGTLHIESPVEILTLRLTDLSGRVLQEYTEKAKQLSINTENYGNGSYLLFLETENGTIIRKFTVK
jgi:PKD repeat protein